jgi:hypothetical protein
MKRERDEFASQQLVIGMHSPTNADIDDLACQAELPEFADRRIKRPPACLHRYQLPESAVRIAMQLRLLERKPRGKQAAENFGPLAHIEVVL